MSRAPHVERFDLHVGREASPVARVLREDLLYQFRPPIRRLKEFTSVALRPRRFMWRVTMNGVAETHAAELPRSGVRKSCPLPKPIKSKRRWITVAERQASEPVDGQAFQGIEAHRRVNRYVVESAVAVFIRRQEEGMDVAGPCPAQFIFAPKSGGKRPDAGVSQAGTAAPGDVFARRQ